MAPPKRHITVTYVPVHDDDRPVMAWNRIKFKANVPVELDRNNPAHSYMQTEREEVKHPTTGGIAYVHREKRVFMGDAAKGNSSLLVDGVGTPHITVTAKVPPAGHEWAGTNRDELIQLPQIDDFEAGASAIVIS